MKTFIFLIVFSISSLLYAQEITVLHMGDTHSHLDAFGPKDANGNGTIGGISKAAYLIATEKATQPPMQSAVRTNLAIRTRIQIPRGGGVFVLGNQTPGKTVGLLVMARVP